MAEAYTEEITLEKRLKEDAEFIEGELDRRLDPELLGGGKMAEAIRYAVLGGGKRIRAFLTLPYVRRQYPRRGGLCKCYRNGARVLAHTRRYARDG